MKFVSLICFRICRVPQHPLHMIKLEQTGAALVLNNIPWGGLPFCYSSILVFPPCPALLTQPYLLQRFWRANSFLSWNMNNVCFLKLLFKGILTSPFMQLLHFTTCKLLTKHSIFLHSDNSDVFVLGIYTTANPEGRSRFWFWDPCGAAGGVGAFWHRGCCSKQVPKWPGQVLNRHLMERSGYPVITATLSCFISFWHILLRCLEVNKRRKVCDGTFSSYREMVPKGLAGVAGACAEPLQYFWLLPVV